MGGMAWAAENLTRALDGPPPPPHCSRCRDQKIVPDWSNWDAYHGEPKPKPCPACQAPADRTAIVDGPVEPPACCVCGSTAVVYRNYQGKPFCCPCARCCPTETPTDSLSTA